MRLSTRAATPVARFVVPSALLTLLLTSIVLLGGASPASAVTAEHTIGMQCSTKAFDTSYDVGPADYSITTTVPASAENGSTILLRWTIDRLPASVPFDITGASFSTDSRLVADRPGNPSTDVSDVTDTTDPGPLDAFAELPGTHSFSSPYLVSVDAPGDAVTIRPGPLRIDYVTADDDLTGAYLSCDPTDPSEVLATLNVTNVDPGCVITDTCPTGQTFVGNPEPNVLSIDGTPNEGNATVQFPDSPTAAASGMHTVPDVFFGRVTDTRSAALGWSLTAQLTEPMQTPAGATLPDTALVVSGLTCNPPTGATGAAPSDAGDGGTLDDPTPLCAVAAGSLGSTGSAGGQWDVFGDLTLTVRSYQSVGEYAGTITLVLS